MRRRRCADTKRLWGCVAIGDCKAGVGGAAGHGHKGDYKAGVGGAAGHGHKGDYTAGVGGVAYPILSQV